MTTMIPESIKMPLSNAKLREGVWNSESHLNDLII
jgi:hypothetical protein